MSQYALMGATWAPWIIATGEDDTFSMLPIDCLLRRVLIKKEYFVRKDGRWFFGSYVVASVCM